MTQKFFRLKAVNIWIFYSRNYLGSSTYVLSTKTLLNLPVSFIKYVPKSITNCWKHCILLCLPLSSLWYWNLWQHIPHIYPNWKYLTTKYCGLYKRDQSVPQTCTSFMIPCHYHYCIIIRYFFCYTNLFTIPINYLLFFAVILHAKPISSSLWYYRKMSYAPGRSPYYTWKKTD